MGNVYHPLEMPHTLTPGVAAYYESHPYPPGAQVIGWPDEKPISKYLRVTPAPQKLALVVNNKRLPHQ